MTHDVFISYSTKDKTIADAVCAGMESAGIRCWIAPRDVTPGAEWPLEIVNAVKASRVVLLIFSGSFNESTQTKKEVDCAVNHGKTIIPFRIEEIQPNGTMEYYLASLHWLDALTPPMEAHIGKLVEYVTALLEKQGVQLTRPGVVATQTQPAAPVQPALAKTAPARRKRTGLIAALVLVGFLVLAGGALLLKSLLGASLGKLGVGSSLLRETDGATMLYVPQGEFEMGMDLARARAIASQVQIDPIDEWFEGEQPVHSVSLDAFWIDRTEVTNRMFRIFTEATGYRTEAEVFGKSTVQETEDWLIVSGADWEHPLGSRSNIEGLDAHPVVQVSWNDAGAYCTWAGARLPTEAEWEKTARSDDGRAWPWGDDTPMKRLVNFADASLPVTWSLKNINDGYMYTAPVGSYPDGASPYGALDMAGNVWEWVADWYDIDYYGTSPLVNPAGPAFGEMRSLRGGAWEGFWLSVRTADRYFNFPYLADNMTGFRCAQSPVPEP